MCHTIVLVDDDASLLASLSLYLSNQGFIVKAFHDVSSALQLLDRKQPDLIISDILMPEQDGYKLLIFLRSDVKYKQIPLIFLSAKGMTQDRILGYNLGCHGYLVKPFDPKELLAMIYNVLSHIRNFTPCEIADKDLEIRSALSSLKIDHSLGTFTFREATILKLVLQGMTNKEVAIKLSLSIRNVEKYVSRLLAKTGTKNRTALTQYCYQHNIDFNEGE